MENLQSGLNTEFPATKIEKSFLKATDFQDSPKTLKFLGWKKKANEDVNGVSWKERLKYCLRYTYPQYVLDEAGEKVIGKDGKPWQNKNYDPAYPKGYSIVYKFAEGEFESGSWPLWKAFCSVQPAVGDNLILNRTGEGKDTEWAVVRA